MSLVLSTDSSAYENARNHWINENDVLVVLYPYRVTKNTLDEFTNWLSDQGVTIVRHRTKIRVVDSMCVAVGLDIMEFDSDENKMIFLLRWS